MKSLHYFIQQSRVLGLYRDYLKVCYQVQDIDTRQYFIQMVRNEFTKHNGQEDHQLIDYYVADGRNRLKELKVMVHQAN